MRALCLTWPEGCILCCPTVCRTAQSSLPFVSCSHRSFLPAGLAPDAISGQRHQAAARLRDWNALKVSGADVRDSALYCCCLRGPVVDAQENGASGTNRTCDPPLRRGMLYPLSYGGVVPDCTGCVGGVSGTAGEGLVAVGRLSTGTMRLRSSTSRGSLRMASCRAAASMALA